MKVVWSRHLEMAWEGLNWHSFMSACRNVSKGGKYGVVFEASITFVPIYITRFTVALYVFPGSFAAVAMDTTPLWPNLVSLHSKMTNFTSIHICNVMNKSVAQHMLMFIDYIPCMGLGTAANAGAVVYFHYLRLFIPNFVKWNLAPLFPPSPSAHMHAAYQSSV